MPDSTQYTRLNKTGTSAGLTSRWYGLTYLEKSLLLLSIICLVTILALSISLAKCEANGHDVTTTPLPSTTQLPNTTAVSPTTNSTEQPITNSTSSTESTTKPSTTKLTTKLTTTEQPITNSTSSTESTTKPSTTKLTTKLTTTLTTKLPTKLPTKFPSTTNYSMEIENTPKYTTPHNTILTAKEKEVGSEPTKSTVTPNNTST